VGYFRGGGGGYFQGGGGGGGGGVLFWVILGRFLSDLNLPLELDFMKIIVLV
jgi:hypothetical protein